MFIINKFSKGGPGSGRYPLGSGEANRTYASRKYDFNNPELLKNPLINSFLNSISHDRDAILYISRMSKENRPELDEIERIIRKEILLKSGFGNLPTIESPEDFIKTDNSEQIVFRGFRDSGNLSTVSATSDEIHNNFLNEPPETTDYIPVGHNGSGLYASRIDRALGYATGNISYEWGHEDSDYKYELSQMNENGTLTQGLSNIQAMKVKKSNFVEFEKVVKMRNDRLIALSKDMKKMHKNGQNILPEYRAKQLEYMSYQLDISYFAMANQIDGFIMKKKSYGEPPHMVIFNRGSIKTTDFGDLVRQNGESLLDMSTFDFGDGTWN